MIGKRVRIALLLGGLALTLCLSCGVSVESSEEECQRLMNLRSEYQMWEQAQPGPGVSLTCPDRPLAKPQVSIKASSQSAATIQIWFDDQEVARGTSQVSAIVTNVADGRHRVSAVSDWCLDIPEKYHLVSDGTTKYCPSSMTEQWVVVDTTPPDLNAKAKIEREVVVVNGWVGDYTTGVDIVACEGQSIHIGSSEGSFGFQIPYYKVPPQEVWLTAVDVVGNTTSSQSALVSLPSDRWERRDADGELVELHTEPNFFPPAGILLAGGIEWRHFQNDELQALPPNRWEKTGADGGLLEVRTDSSFCPDGGLLGFGSGVEWRQYVGGQLKPPVLYTPGEWYLFLGVVASSPLWGTIVVALYWTLVSHWLVRRTVKAFCGMLTAITQEGQRLLAERAGQPAIPEPVQQVLSGFLTARPEVAADLEAYLVERQRAFLTDGREVSS